MKVIQEEIPVDDPGHQAINTYLIMSCYALSGFMQTLFRSFHVQLEDRNAIFETPC